MEDNSESEKMAANHNEFIARWNRNKAIAQNIVLIPIILFVVVVVVVVVVTAIWHALFGG